MGHDAEADVSGVCEHPFVTDSADLGGQQQQIRLAKLEERCDRLEAWNLDLEDEVVRLRETLAAAFSAAAQAVVLPTNTA